MAGDRYEPEAFRAVVDRLIETFTPEFFEKRRGWIAPSELPVFVVGMPRSGTTLVHQIAASHPAVFGAGELNHVARIVMALDDISAWTVESLTEASQQHLQRLQLFGRQGAAGSRQDAKQPASPRPDRDFVPRGARDFLPAAIHEIHACRAISRGSPMGTPFHSTWPIAAISTGKTTG